MKDIKDLSQWGRHTIFVDWKIQQSRGGSSPPNWPKDLIHFELRSQEEFIIVVVGTNKLVLKFI